MSPGDPVTRREDRIAAIVESALGIAEVDRDANLFSLGATSVTIVRIVNALERELGIRPSIRAVYEAPTVRVNRPIAEQAAFGIFLLMRGRAIVPMYDGHSVHFATLEAGAIAHLLETVAHEVGLGLCRIGSIDWERVRPAFEIDDDDRLLHSSCARSCRGQDLPRNGRSCSTHRSIRTLLTEKGRLKFLFAIRYSQTQMQALEAHVRQHVYLTVQEIVAYVKERCGRCCSLAFMKPSRSCAPAVGSRCDSSPEDHTSLYWPATSLLYASKVPLISGNVNTPEVLAA